MGEVDKSIEIYNRVLKIDDEIADVYYNLANA